MRSTDPSSDDDDDVRLARYASDLEVGLREHLGSWVEQTLADRLGRPVDDAARTAIEPAVERVLEEIGELLRTDIDRQATNPLSVVRSLVGPMTGVLDDAGLVPPARDVDAVRLFPDDLYDLVPAAFGDIHPELHEIGLTWGAAKAHVHLRRRRAEGLIP